MLGDRSYSFGGIDGFIAEISGTSLVRATYLGTGGTDQIFGIQFDKYGFPYVMGQTTGVGRCQCGFCKSRSKAIYFKIAARSFRLCIFNNIWFEIKATRIFPNSILVDRCENVYVAGWGDVSGASSLKHHLIQMRDSGMPVTPDAFKKTLMVETFIFFVLTEGCRAQLYGSFFGKITGEWGDGCDHVDGGTSRFDQNGVIYEAICANCKLLDPEAIFPTTPGHGRRVIRQKMEPNVILLL
jgi:hypothetical protein